MLEALLTRIQKNAAQPRAARAASTEVADSRVHARPLSMKETVKETDGIPVARFDPRAEPASDPAFVAVKQPTTTAPPKQDPLAVTAEAPAVRPAAQARPAATPIAAKPAGEAPKAEAPKAARPIGTGFGVRSAFPPKTGAAAPAASPKPPVVAAKPAPAPSPAPPVVTEKPELDVSPLPPVAVEPAAAREAAPATKVKDEAPDGIEAVLARAVVSVDGGLEPATYDAPNPDPALAPAPDLPVEPAQLDVGPVDIAPALPIEEPAPAPLPAETKPVAEQAPIEEAKPATPPAAPVVVAAEASPLPPPALEPKKADLAEPPSKFATEAPLTEKKKGSMVPLLLVALLFIVGAAVAFYFLRMRKEVATTDTQPPATAKPTSTATTTAKATATATAAPTGDATATATAATSAAPALDPAALPKTSAYLSVKAPEGKTMDVLISGKKVGDTSAPFETNCQGAKFVSLAEAGTAKPVGRAKSLTLTCQSVNDVEFTEADMRALPPPTQPTAGTPPTAPPTAPTPPTDAYDPATP